jgi:hypothetical protein
MMALVLNTDTNPGVARWTEINDLINDTVDILPSGSGAAVMPENARIALCDTTNGAIILFLPTVGEGRLTVRIVAGTLPVEITPFDSTEGVNGSAASTFLLDPTQGLTSVEFVGDVANSVWWRII